MPFWQYALQDLQGAAAVLLRCRRSGFPVPLPERRDLLFYTSLTHYRLYIIAWTGAAALRCQPRSAELGTLGDALALGGFALALAAAPIWNEGNGQLLRRTAADALF